MKNKQYKLDIIPGIVLALFSIGYLALIPQIQTFTGMGATPLTNHFIPTLWGGFLLARGRLWAAGPEPVDHRPGLPEAEEVPGGGRKDREYLPEGRHHGAA